MRTPNFKEEKQNINLPAPIILNVKDKKWLLSGNRRINFAYEEGLPIVVWMVQL